MAELTTAQVWEAMAANNFAVLGMVSARQEARTAGVIYVIHDRTLYIGSEKSAWKVKHVAGNPNISVTVAIPKRVPLMPWIKVPAATITFAATGKILTADDVSPAVLEPLFRGMTNIDELRENMAIIAVEPKGYFITYGVGVSLMEMRDPAKAGGRAPVG